MNRFSYERIDQRAFPYWDTFSKSLTKQSTSHAGEGRKRVCGFSILRKYFVLFYSFQLCGLSSLVPLCSLTHGLTAWALCSHRLRGCWPLPSVAVAATATLCRVFLCPWVGSLFPMSLDPWLKVRTNLSSSVSSVTIATC